MILQSLGPGDPAPFEGKGLLRRLERLAENTLGEDIRELGRRRDADEPHLAILDDLVGELLLDVVVFSLLPGPETDYLFY